MEDAENNGLMADLRKITLEEMKANGYPEEVLGEIYVEFTTDRISRIQRMVITFIILNNFYSIHNGGSIKISSLKLRKKYMAGK